MELSTYQIETLKAARSSPRSTIPRDTHPHTVRIFKDRGMIRADRTITPIGLVALERAEGNAE
jgi:hypothetical protein